MPTTKIKKTSLDDASAATKVAVDAITKELRFVLGLDARTKRDLVKYPPVDTEPISNMGIPMSTGADRIRIWINNDFRIPSGERALKSGEVKKTTKYSALRKLAGFES